MDSLALKWFKYGTYLIDVLDIFQSIRDICKVKSKSFFSYTKCVGILSILIKLSINAIFWLAIMDGLMSKEFVDPELLRSGNNKHKFHIQYDIFISIMFQNVILL